MKLSEFETEWCLLQNQYDSYEKHSLYIKLFSIMVVIVALISNTASVFIALIMLVLWLQDAIWKTFQSRIEPRLLQIEQVVLQLVQCENSESASAELYSKVPAAFQFNSQYNQVRLTGLSLIKEYVSQSVRPTVAFPYMVLILIIFVQYLL